MYVHWTPLGQIKVCQSVRYTNEAFGTDKNVLFMEVSSIQGCPYRGVPLYFINHVFGMICVTIKQDTCS